MVSDDLSWAFGDASVTLQESESAMTTGHEVASSKREGRRSIDAFLYARFLTLLSVCNVGLRHGTLHRGYKIDSGFIGAQPTFSKIFALALNLHVGPLHSGGRR